MKRVLPLLFTLLLIPALIGCDSGSDDDDGGNNPNNAGTLTATADGSSFQSELVTVTFQSGVLSIAGITNADGSDGSTQRQIILTIPNAATGTFGVSPFMGVIATYADADLTNPANAYAGTSGQIVIDALSDSSAEGSFSFTATNNGGDTVEISNGQFDVTF